MSTISIIVPNYNHAPFLRQRIDSILSQTFQDFELILIDDGSVDNSREIMEGYRNISHVSQIVYNNTNSGSAFLQWNKGIKLAKGKWIWIAESDDYAEPTFLERLLSETDKVSDCSLAYTSTWWVDEKGNKLWETPCSDHVNVYLGKKFIRRKLAVCNSIANVSECIFRRNCYRPEESYRYENMRLCGDWFFYVLLAEQGSVVKLDEPLSYYRQHDSNISSDAERHGLTFLEGTEILDYMKAHCDLTSSEYARGWGRLWARYERLYSFTPEVKRQVKEHMAHYPDIVFWHRLYQLKRWHA